MKTWLTILLTALAAVSSVTSATDTLTINSHRIINTCSGEKRWLLSASIGEVFDSDSLMSFDITIGFDTTLLRPTDGLFAGTLAEQMKFADISPGVNFRVPGEMRVSAFTITRNVKGNLPLFAVAGEYVGSCGSFDSLTVPWAPEFNEEFKKWTKTIVTSRVSTRAIPTPNPNEGVSVIEEALIFNQGEPIRNLSSLVRVPSNSGQRIKTTYQLLQEHASIQDIRVIALDPVVEINDEKSKAEVTFTASSQGDTVYLRIEGVSQSDKQLDTLVANVQILDTCSCSQPTILSRVPIVIDSIVVSTASDLNEDPLTVEHYSNRLIVKSLHGDLQKILVSDLLGRVQLALSIKNQPFVEIPTTEFGSGLFILTMTTANGIQTQLFQQ